jgi:hypothetical protein
MGGEPGTFLFFFYFLTINLLATAAPHPVCPNTITFDIGSTLYTQPGQYLTGDSLGIVWAEFSTLS